VCATSNGGCGSATYATCKNNVGVAPTCTAVDVCATSNGGCGSATYATCKNNVGVAPTCTAVDVCATSNGGCGSATYWTCTNNVGTAPTCADINECTATNVCTADDPCVNLSGCYTCRGQFADWAPADSPATFTVNSNGTVTDSQSGLLWQQTLPATYTGCSGRSSIVGDTCTWAEAGTYCTGLSLAGTGWRLPTKAELESIVDYGRYNPAIDPTAFPSTPATWFWSTSPYVGSSGIAWSVKFFSGSSYDLDATNTYRVRCVR
jgi:hypothetical protein